MDSNVLIAFFGLIISGLVYLKDRPVVVVSLRFDLKKHDQGFITGSNVKSDGSHFAVIVHNAGRRPVCLDSLQIVTASSTHLVRNEETRDTETFVLAEGSPPIIKAGLQEWLSPHKEQWWQVRAVIHDITGKFYYSDYLTDAPPWAENIDAPRSALIKNKIKNKIKKYILRYLPS